MSANGKGDRNRSCTPEYRDNYDSIFRKQTNKLCKQKVYSSELALQTPTSSTQPLVEDSPIVPSPTRSTYRSGNLW